MLVLSFLPSPFLKKRVIAWMFQGYHINLKGNVNLLYNVPLSSKQSQIQTEFYCIVQMFPVCQKDEGKEDHRYPCMQWIVVFSGIKSIGWGNQVQTSDYWVGTGDMQFLSAVCCTHSALDMIDFNKNYVSTYRSLRCVPSAPRNQLYSLFTDTGSLLLQDQ